MTTRQRYVIDTNASRFTVKAFAGGMSAAMGHSPTIAIRDFHGEVCCCLENFQESTLEMRIVAASLSVDEDMAEEDREELERLMNEEVLKTSQHSEILFHSVEVKAAQVTGGMYLAEVQGELTLNGVTRSHTFGAHVVLQAKSLRASGDFRVRQSDYEIRLVSVAGGLLTLRDELKCAFSIVANLAE
jgi:polyisoprenoid-binding protein YceI